MQIAKRFTRCKYESVLVYSLNYIKNTMMNCYSTETNLENIVCIIDQTISLNLRKTAKIKTGRATRGKQSLHQEKMRTVHQCCLVF
jgi:hypothetical protein